MSWTNVLMGVAAAVAATWGLLLVGLLLVRPHGPLLSEALRLLPDMLRLLPRLARASDLPLPVRIRLWLLLGYLALPIDLVPDIIPVVGYADDAIIVAAVLRSVVRHAGIEVVHDCWPGTPDGLAALRKLTGLPDR